MKFAWLSVMGLLLFLVAPVSVSAQYLDVPAPSWYYEQDYVPAAHVRTSCYRGVCHRYTVRAPRVVVPIPVPRPRYVVPPHRYEYDDDAF